MLLGSVWKDNRDRLMRESGSRERSRGGKPVTTSPTCEFFMEETLGE